jgi:hypothetical protein
VRCHQRLIDRFNQDPQPSQNYRKMLGRRIKKKGQASASQQNESQKTAEQLNQERAERNAKAEAGEMPGSSHGRGVDLS